MVLPCIVSHFHTIVFLYTCFDGVRGLGNVHGCGERQRPFIMALLCPNTRKYSASTLIVIFLAASYRKAVRKSNLRIIWRTSHWPLKHLNSFPFRSKERKMNSKLVSKLLLMIHFQRSRSTWIASLLQMCDISFYSYAIDFFHSQL